MKTSIKLVPVAVKAYLESHEPWVWLREAVKGKRSQDREERRDGGNN